MRRDRLLACFLLPSLLSGCQGGGYDPSWGDDLLGGPKGDGLVDTAIDISIGETVSGEVTEESIVLYRVDLEEGDELSIVMERTSGDLSPHVTVFEGFNKTLHSTSFQVNGGLLTKTYEVEATRGHFLAARAFQNQGSGQYQLSIECTGGPCSGAVDDNVDPLTVADADACIAQAQQCAFDEMEKFDGAVREIRARNLFEGCLEAGQTEDGKPCADACAVQDPDFFNQDNTFLCNAVIDEIPFFADQSQACLDELDSCVDECFLMGETFAIDDNEDVPFAWCWSFGFNGSCPLYARATTACGGQADGVAACHEFCQSTTGIWLDDLDDLCELDCGPLP